MAVVTLDQHRKTLLRDLARLERLEERHRVRAEITRAMRGAVGFILGLFMAWKLKIGASLGAKLLVALLVAAGFAWPMIALAFLAIAVVILFIFALFHGGDAGGHCDCPTCDGCTYRNRRRERLLEMIAHRRKWLTEGGALPPRRLRGSRLWPMNV